MPCGYQPSPGRGSCWVEEVWAVVAAPYRSILNPIFSLTWNSSTLPSLILPLSPATSNQFIWRIVLAASLTAALVASAKLTGDVPTSSVILYVADMASALPSCSNPSYADFAGLARALSSYGPRRLVTDKLRSYPAARRSVMPSVIHVTDQYANNRAEVSHQPTRQRVGAREGALGCYLASHGYRCIAHDRRGHGRSSQPWNGNEMDTYADDLSALIETLNLTGTTLVGHSTGGGEVARYIGRHGTKRVAKAALVGAVTPLMLKTDANPRGLPIKAFDEIRAGVAADRSQFFKDLTTPFYGANRPDAKVSQGVRDAFWFQGMQGGLKNEFDCIKAFSETDFTEDLKKFDVPTLIIHGDDDQIVPIGASADASSKLVKNATLKVYPGGPHGLAVTHNDELNADLLAFLTA